MLQTVFYSITLEIGHSRCHRSSKYALPKDGNTRNHLSQTRELLSLLKHSSGQRKIAHGEKYLNVMLNECAIIQQLTILNRQQRRIKITLATNIKCTKPRQEYYDVMVIVQKLAYRQDPCVHISNSAAHVFGFSDARFIIKQKRKELVPPVNIQFSFPLVQINLYCLSMNLENEKNKLISYFKYFRCMNVVKKLTTRDLKYVNLSFKHNYKNIFSAN